jgi:hypothetical protein
MGQKEQNATKCHQKWPWPMPNEGFNQPNGRKKNGKEKELVKRGPRAEKQQFRQNAHLSGYLIINYILELINLKISILIKNNGKLFKWPILFGLNKKVHKEPVQFDRSDGTGLIDPAILILLQYYMGNIGK